MNSTFTGSISDLPFAIVAPPGSVPSFFKRAFIDKVLF
jgi:hypothetical protein